MKFRTKIEADGTLTMIRLPFDVRAEFGKARPAVKVTVAGHTYRSTVATYGGEYFLPLRKSHRDAAGVRAGQLVSVTVVADAEPRVVRIPDDLGRALKKNRRARERWDALSYTHRREHVEAIEAAKKPETRARRVARALEMLSGDDN